MTGTGDDEVDGKLQEWMKIDRNESTRAEMQKLAENGNVDQLRKLLLKRMEFGTAGLRSGMGTGFSQMNDVTIIQTSQGLSKYLLKTCPDVKKRGVVIGYDGRHNSHRFASLAARVLINDEIPVYLFSTLCPTPYVPYSVLHYKTECGIMVTASHNPKNDNGYKVYWGNGAQIISPIDKGIAESILQNLEIQDSSWDHATIRSSPLCKDPLNTILEAYNRDLCSLCYFKEKNQSSPVKFTYTGMHGVGYEYVKKACQSFGFVEPIPVKEQVEPDPEFPTVKYPNPEEGEGALLLAMKTADENNSNVILANDPDADRLAVAEKLTNGHWHIFSGNEIGALLGWWSWFSFVQRYPDYPVGELYMLASTVSSKILQTIGNKEGFQFEETLTGFKWMGNLATTLQKQGKKVLFAFEEAIGFMCGTNVLDKDGISAAMVLSELATYLYSNNTTLHNKLDEIFKTYGYHLSSNSYFICHEQDKIKKMFEEIRNYNNSGKYPEACGPYKIKYIRDLTVGYDNSKPDCKPVLPVSKSSQMITFTFENGCVATLRTSGTEPKIKYYTEVKPDPQKGLDRQGAQKELDDIVQCIIKYFYQPEKFGFTPRST